jgi:energy-coupling factor transport system ATP-binding protein
MAGTPLAKTSLEGVTLCVERGETLAIIGSTGSGKSTLLQHINGLYTPQSGTVIVAGEDLSSKQTDLTRIRRKVGLVLQNPAQQVFERFSGDDVAFGPRMAGYRGRELVARVKRAMETVGLSFDEFKDRPTFALSGGERRKVGLAGVLALEPSILLLDEPTAGLDPESHEELLGQLEKLRDNGATIVIATHSMDDVVRLADRVIALKSGRIVLEGSTREIFARGSELEEMGLGLPVAGKVCQLLAREGWQIQTDALSIEEAETAILSALGEHR